MSNYKQIVNLSESINKEEINYWIDHNLNNYLKTSLENVSEIEHIIDFFLSKKEKIRLHKMSYQVAVELSKQWIEKLNKKSGEIIETEEDTELLFNLKDGCRVVKLVSESSYKREGLLMSHCVASYYAKSNIEIVSLRDVNNKPHCTIEFQKTNNVINQIKGKGNGSIHPKYIKAVIKILKKFNVEIRESELKNLGYINLNEKQWLYLEENFENLKWIMFNNTKFLYTNLKYK